MAPNPYMPVFAVSYKATIDKQNKKGILYQDAFTTGADDHELTTTGTTNRKYQLRAHVRHQLCFGTLHTIIYKVKLNTIYS